MSSKYSKSNKYKVTSKDILDDTINLTNINNNNDTMQYDVLPDIVSYTTLKHNEYDIGTLTKDMITYLSCITNNKKCGQYNDVTVALWRQQNKLFDECIREFINITIDMQEQNMILDSNKSDNIKMFVTKRWKPEYRDNVLPAQTIGTVINVNLIDGKDTIDKVKDITDSAIDKLIEE